MEVELKVLVGFIKDKGCQCYNRRPSKSVLSGLGVKSKEKVKSRRN